MAEGRQSARRLASGFALLLLLAAGQPAGAETLRDPTQPWMPQAEAYAAPAPRYAVTAIFVSSARSVAILNGRRVGVGDEIEGARVVAIHRDEVTLEVGGEELILRPRGAAPRSGN